MTRTDAAQFLETWENKLKKIFMYTQEFLKPDYLTIEKVNGEIQGDGLPLDVSFNILKLESTANIEDFTPERFELMLMNEELKEYKDGKWYFSILEYKTNGCDCGAFVTQNPEHHSFWCRKWIK